MAEAGSRLAEIRKKFQGNGAGYVPTPESQFTKMKQDKVQQAKAIRIARARAARYNMTLRSLAIKTNQDVTKMQRNDMAAKKEAQERASKYNMTSRALPVAVVSKRDQQNIARALQDGVSPDVAKDVISAVAANHHADNVKATSLMRAPVAKTDKPKRELPPPQEEALEPEAEKPKAKESEVKAEPEKKKERFEMKGLGAALQAGDEEALNKSILDNFLEESAPHLLGKSDVLLKKYKSQLHLLFDKLLTEYGDGTDAEVSGKQKAEKEVAEAVKEAPPVQKIAKVSAPAPALTPSPTPAPAPAADDNEEDDEDSMIITPENMDTLEADIKKPDPVVPKPGAVEQIDLEDDEDSLIIEADKAYQNGYEETIKAAEESPEAAFAAAAKRKQTEKLDAELQKELSTTYKEAKKSIASAVSDDSLVQTDTPAAMLEGGYIVAVEREEDEEKEEPSRWAVQFQNKNYALKQKLLKQGLSKQQVEELVDNLEVNTSEML